MATYRFEDADKYNSGSSGSFFQLQNDGDIGTVRFMYNSLDDVVAHLVHPVTVDGKIKYISCPRHYNDPKDICPLCADGRKLQTKLFVPVYDLDEKIVKIWERGRNFWSQISGLCNRYASGNTSLVSHTFEVERHGQPKDTSTSYMIFETGCDDTTLEDLPETPSLENLVLEKSAEDMRVFIETGYFPNNDGAPARHTQESTSMPTGRRTPARRGEAF